MARARGDLKRLFRPEPDVGLDLLLVVTYAVIITEKVNRSIVALIGAALMVVVGVLTRRRRSPGSTGTRSAFSPA